MRGQIDEAVPRPKAHRFSTPHSPDYILLCLINAFSHFGLQCACAGRMQSETHRGTSIHSEACPPPKHSASELCSVRRGFSCSLMLNFISCFVFIDSILAFGQNLCLCGKKNSPSEIRLSLLKGRCVQRQHVHLCVCFTFTLRGLSLGLLRGSEEYRLAQRACPRHADELDVHNVVCLLLQVP